MKNINYKFADSPLLLYMESGGAHSASAVFSDATTGEWCILQFEGNWMKTCSFQIVKNGSPMQLLMSGAIYSFRGWMVVSGVHYYLELGRKEERRVSAHLMSTIWKGGCRYHLEGVNSIQFELGTLIVSGPVVSGCVKGSIDKHVASFQLLLYPFVSN